MGRMAGTRGKGVAEEGQLRGAGSGWKGLEKGLGEIKEIWGAVQEKLGTSGENRSVG